ncbi:MAG TPA: AbrB/MazE/SpoVT family DNA-binding domain-containing protein [Candidatus Onthousia faecigallinarum]|mgnify:CR=1 FL=1|nr:AbrB/MazE/SpoVT family DNA-binding domain-containing protein [Candidatus Onthousia faecigallinarum]
MENVGFTRKIDNLGRIVIPREYRKILNIKDYDLINITLNNNKLVLKKQNNSIDYEEILYNVLKSKKDYNYLVTKEDVRKLELLIDDFIQDMKNKSN